MKFNWRTKIFIVNFIFSNFLDAIPFGKRKNDMEDVICNIEDEHECVCNRTTGNLDKIYMPCHEFMEVKNLEVVSIILRDINLTGRLYTNETYEQYLRRRIAQILSQYCENMPEDCPGTLAELRSQRKKTSTYELNEKTVTVLDDGPIFTRGNVVILRVQYPENGRTELFFVVLKMANTIGISPSLVLYPTTVKYILSAQFAPLSRVLGGIRIEQFGVSSLEKPVPSADNSTLIIIVTVITTLILICCTIAAVKVVIDIRSAKREKKENKETASDEKRCTRNYGTCTEKLFSNYQNEMPNGRAKSKSICSRSSNSSKKRKDKKISKCSNELEKTILEERTNNDDDISPRPGYQNIFICDHSQLPKECVEEEFEIEVKKVKRQNLNVQPTRSPFSSDDDSAFHFPEKPRRNEEKRFSFSDNIPCVILDDGNERGNKGNDLDDAKEVQILHLNLTPKNIDGGFLSLGIETTERPQSRAGEFVHPFDRPLSRRGSRDEKQDEGEEETFNDTREDTPVPLGDDQVFVEKPLIDVLINKTKKRVEKMLIISATESENTEDEEENIFDKPLKNNRNKQRSGSSSDSEVEEKNEKEMLDRHQYERLLESPLPATKETKNPTIILND